MTIRQLLAHPTVLGTVALASAASAAEPWQDAIAQGLGKTGTVMSGGVYRVGLPRTDLAVTLDGVRIKPALALGSWLAFTKTGDNEVMVMGDLVLNADEVNPVLKALRTNGIEVTALHNHMLDEEPRLFFMHFWANDDASRLAEGLREALDQAKVAKG